MQDRLFEDPELVQFYDIENGWADDARYCRELARGKKSVLDLGCGTGLCGVQFRDWARTLTGVDLSPNMLAKARERGLYDELLQGDAVVAMRERPGRFDLVVASVTVSVPLLKMPPPLTPT